MATRMHDAIVALQALWAAAPAFEGVKVVDGPQANSDAGKEWLFVGYDADELSEVNEGAAAEQQWMAQTVKREVGEVISAIVVKSGAIDIPTVRARAYDLLSECEDLVRANRAQLASGGLMDITVSSHRFIPMITSGGCKARVVFSTTYQAQI